jgi:uncharacterized membrane protein
MILAAYRDGVYNFLLFLHLFLVIIGVGAAFAIPVMAVQLRKLQGSSLTQAATSAYDSARFLIVPPIVLAGLIGPFLVMVSDDVYSMGDTWVSLSFVLWFAAIAIGLGVQWPNERKKVQVSKALEADGSDKPGLGAELDGLYKKGAMFGGINHLIFIALLVVMIWQPGV